MKHLSARFHWDQQFCTSSYVLGGWKSDVLKHSMMMDLEIEKKEKDPIKFSKSLAVMDVLSYIISNSKAIETEVSKTLQTSKTSKQVPCKAFAFPAKMSHNPS